MMNQHRWITSVALLACTAVLAVIASSPADAVEEPQPAQDTPPSMTVERPLDASLIGSEEAPFRPLFERVIGEDAAAQQIYDSMLKDEPGAFEAAYAWAKAEPGSQDREKLRARAMEAMVEAWRGVIEAYDAKVRSALDRGRGGRALTQPAPNSVQRSITALLFLRGVLGGAAPTEIGKAQRKLMRFGYNPYKFAEKARGKKLERLRTWQDISRFGLLAARGDFELENSIYIATFYRDWETAKDLAVRASRADFLSSETYFLAAHALLARGDGADPEEEKAALRLLQLNGFVRKNIASFELGSEPISEVAIREMALQTLMTMNGVDPAKQENLKETRPNCPFARAVSVFRVKDNSAWPKIIERWKKRIDDDWKRKRDKVVFGQEKVSGTF